MSNETTVPNAGRALDAEIAAQVMGWVPGAGFSVDTYWAFSTDVADAWQIVARLRADGWLMTLRDCDAFGFRCEFGSTSPDLADVHANAVTAPLAICLAALAARAGRAQGGAI